MAHKSPPQRFFKRNNVNKRSQKTATTFKKIKIEQCRAVVTATKFTKRRKKEYEEQNAVEELKVI